MVSAWVIAQRADYRIIPLPKSVQTDTTQVFTLRSGMGIAYDTQNPQVAQNATFLQQWVMEATGVELALTPSDAKAAVRLIQGTQTEAADTPAAGILHPHRGQQRHRNPRSPA